MTELVLVFWQVFVVSTSEWDPVQKTNFAASIANFSAKHYHMKNRLFLAITDTTRATVPKDEFAFISDTLICTQALIDDWNWEGPKTGQMIGDEECWLKMHTGIGCKPEFLGLHSVDGASNVTSMRAAMT